MMVWKRIGAGVTMVAVMACASTPPAPSPAVSGEVDVSVPPPIPDVPPSSMPGAATPARDPNTPRYEFEVEMPATAVTSPTPVYPEQLRRSGVRGYLNLEFVVDTLGTVEPTGFRVLAVEPKAAESAFVDAVRSALLASRYRPAQFDGKKVRQRVQQRFEFVPSALEMHRSSASRGPRSHGPGQKPTPSRCGFVLAVVRRPRLSFREFHGAVDGRANRYPHLPRSYEPRDRFRAPSAVGPPVCSDCSARPAYASFRMDQLRQSRARVIAGRFSGRRSRKVLHGAAASCNATSAMRYDCEMQQYETSYAVRH